MAAKRTHYIPTIAPDLASDLALALALADDADAITTSRFRAHDLRVETKPDLTPVSEADQAVEAAVRPRLARERPDDAIVGEELGAEGDASRCWVIDPIDGTKSYVRGVPAWATLLALEVGGEVVLGVVSAPALHRRWWAARGAGAFADGDPIHVSEVGALADAQLCLRTSATGSRSASGMPCSSSVDRCGARLASAISGVTCSWRKVRQK